jgi:signal transduction histidine kinase
MDAIDSLSDQSIGTGDNHKSSVDSSVKSAVPRPVFFSLSSRLLVLTVAFVLIAEAAVFAPTMGRFRLDYLREKLATAHLVMTALDVLPQQIDPMIRDRLLEQGGMLGMTITHQNDLPLRLDPARSLPIRARYDFRDDHFGVLIADAFKTMFRTEDFAVAVTGVSSSDPEMVIEVILTERPLRDAMWNYAGRIFVLSIVISVTAASLVYGALQWLAVRPLHRLAEAMIGFREAPEDPSRVIVPKPRNDEVGVAEQSLAEMQRELRAALLNKERLAGMGTAVTKISHDLKNILATAVLESGRLEAVSDPKIKRLTAGMIDAVDRAATLAATTIKFAKEGLPVVRKRNLSLRSFLLGINVLLEPDLKKCVLSLEDIPDISVVGDPNLFKRVLDNLIRNAAEAGAQEVVLSISTEDGHVDVRVSDNGPGLAPRALENLFVPFAGSARAAGSGLGLPIAKELMRAQGGDLKLGYTSDDGTCFIVRLPA